MNAATGQSEFAEALLWKQEIGRIQQGKGPGESDDSDPFLLMRVRLMYLDRLERVERIRSAREQELLLEYDKKLEAIEMQLSSEQELEEAQRVRDLRDALKKEVELQPDATEEPEQLG